MHGVVVIVGFIAIFEKLNFSQIQAICKRRYTLPQIIIITIYKSTLSRKTKNYLSPNDHVTHEFEITLVTYSTPVLHYGPLHS